MSDVTLCSDDDEDGGGGSGSGSVRFKAHRVVLCAQSEYFDAMLLRGSFAEQSSPEVRLPGTTARALELLLEYLYTGDCVFAPNDTVLALSVLRVRAKKKK